MKTIVQYLLTIEVDTPDPDLAYLEGKTQAPATCYQGSVAGTSIHTNLPDSIMRTIGEVLHEAKADGLWKGDANVSVPALLQTITATDSHPIID